MQYLDYFTLFNLGTCQRPSWLKHHTIIIASVCYVIAPFHYWSCSSVHAVSFHQTTISSYSASERILGNWSSRFMLDWVTQWLWVDSHTDHVLWALHLSLCLMCRLTQLQHKNSELQERCRGAEGEVSCVCVSVYQVGHMLFLTMYMHIVLCYLFVLFFGAVGTVQEETRQLWCHQGECSKVNTWLCWTDQLCFAFWHADAYANDLSVYEHVVQGFVLHCLSAYALTLWVTVCLVRVTPWYGFLHKFHFILSFVAVFSLIRD